MQSSISTGAGDGGGQLLGQFVRWSCGCIGISTAAGPLVLRAHKLRAGRINLHLQLDNALLELEPTSLTKEETRLFIEQYALELASLVSLEKEMTEIAVEFLRR